MTPEPNKQVNVPGKQPQPPAAAKEPAKEVPQPPAEAKPGKPYDEFLGRAQKAYSAYLDAQKDIWVAYRETEQKTDEDLTKIEANAFALLSKALSLAAQNQKTAEKQAEEIYLRAKEQSKAAYDQSVQQAMNDFNTAVKQAFEQRKTTLSEAWAIFAK